VSITDISCVAVALTGSEFCTDGPGGATYW